MGFALTKALRSNSFTTKYLRVGGAVAINLCLTALMKAKTTNNSSEILTIMHKIGNKVRNKMRVYYILLIASSANAE